MKYGFLYPFFTSISFHILLYILSFQIICQLQLHILQVQDLPGSKETKEICLLKQKTSVINSQHLDQSYIFTSSDEKRWVLIWPMLSTTHAFGEYLNIYKVVWKKNDYLPKQQKFLFQSNHLSQHGLLAVFIILDINLFCGSDLNCNQKVIGYFIIVITYCVNEYIFLEGWYCEMCYPVLVFSLPQKPGQHHLCNIIANHKRGSL